MDHEALVIAIGVETAENLSYAVSCEVLSTHPRPSLIWSSKRAHNFPGDGYGHPSLDPYVLLIFAHVLAFFHSCSMLLPTRLSIHMSTNEPSDICDVGRRAPAEFRGGSGRCRRRLRWHEFLIHPEMITWGVSLNYLTFYLENAEFCSRFSSEL